MAHSAPQMIRAIPAAHRYRQFETASISAVPKKARLEYLNYVRSAWVSTHDVFYADYPTGFD